jgi:enoyl-CoA hydratase/carnithine racemase
MTAYEHIRYEVDEPCAVVTLNRPEKLNAWTQRMERELKHALAAAEADARVVGIVLTGAGRAFCSGADMSTLSALASGGQLRREAGLDADPGDASVHPGYRHTYSYLASLRKPILAAINGPCVGMAVPIACFCDLRFASEQASFMTVFARRGLIAEWGSSWVLPRLCGAANAMDLLMSGRKVDAAEALRMGLVSRVVAPDALLAEAKGYVRALAESCSPAALEAIKQQVWADLMRPLDEGLADASRRMLGTFDSDDFKEGVASFVEKRAPRFRRIGS